MTGIAGTVEPSARRMDTKGPGLPMIGKWLPIVFSPPMEPIDTRTMFVRPPITEAWVYVETGLRSEGRALMLYEFL